MALSTGTLLKRGMRRRCPVCGQKKLFRRWVQMADRCPRCHLTFRRVEGQWLGSWFLNICLAQVVVLGVMLVAVLATMPQSPMLTIGAVDLAAAILFPLWFFPYSRTIWLAIDLAMRPLEFDEDVDPQWELGADLAHLERERGRAPSRRDRRAGF